MHTYLKRGCESLAHTSASAVLARDLRRESFGGWGVAVIGAVIKHQPSFSPQPPRNCLTMQFLPYVHALFSLLPLSAQLLCVCLCRYFSVYFRLLQAKPASLCDL